MAIAGGIISAGVATYQIVNAEKQKKEAKDAINNFEREELSNPFADLQVSTLGADQQTEANLSRYATSVDALQRGGSRGMAQISQLNDTNVFLQNMISADLDKQDKQRAILQAQGAEKIQAIQDQRETSALLGLGQQLQTGRQDSSSGLMNLMGSVLTTGTAIENKIAENKGVTPPDSTGTVINGVSTANRKSVFNTNGNVIGQNFVEKPAFFWENAFIDPNNPYSFDNASIFDYNSLFT